MCTLCYTTPCCRNYFREWHRESTCIWLVIKTVIVFVLLVLFCVYGGVQYELFGFSELAIGKIIQLLIYVTVISFLFVLYTPYQRKFTPLWFQIIVFLLYFGSLILFIVQFKIVDEEDRFLNPEDYGTNSNAFDLWTINHAFVGLLFAVFLPFVWMFGVVFVWELIELYVYNDTEITANAIVDILVAVVAWLIVMLIFSRKFIPWISAQYTWEVKGSSEIYGADTGRKSAASDYGKTEMHAYV